MGNVARHDLQINNIEIYGNLALSARFSMSVKPVHFYICVCMYMLVHVRVQGYACLWDMCTRRSKSTSGVIPQVPPTFFFFLRQSHYWSGGCQGV